MGGQRDLQSQYRHPRRGARRGARGRRRPAPRLPRRTGPASPTSKQKAAAPQDGGSFYRDQHGGGGGAFVTHGRYTVVAVNAPTASSGGSPGNAGATAARPEASTVHPLSLNRHH